jgi:hypothetical protein
LLLPFLSWARSHFRRKTPSEARRRLVAELSAATTRFLTTPRCYPKIRVLVDPAVSRGDVAEYDRRDEPINNMAMFTQMRLPEPIGIDNVASLVAWVEAAHFGPPPQVIHLWYRGHQQRCDDIRPGFFRRHVEDVLTNETSWADAEKGCARYRKRRD